MMNAPTAMRLTFRPCPTPRRWLQPIDQLPIDTHTGTQYNRYIRALAPTLYEVNLHMDRNQLVELYREADLTCAKLYYRSRGARMYERTPLPPSSDARAQLEAELAAARAAVDALPEPEPVFQLMRGHMRDFLDGEALRLSNYFGRASSAIGELSWKIENFAGVDSRPDAEKVDILMAQLAAVPEIAAATRALLQNASDDDKAALAGECAQVCDNYRHYGANVGRYFPTLNTAAARKLSDAIERACAVIAELTPQIRSGSAPADDESRTARFDEAYYRRVLHDTLGVELDELLSWYRDEISHTRAAVFESAARLPITTTPRTMPEVSTALNQYAGPCDTPEAMLERMSGYLKRAQAAARDWVWFPEEVCRLERVPYPLRESFPWGGYSDGDGRLRPITGKVFLNDGNFRAVTDGWLKMQSIHESYPGHHIQYVRNVTDTLPETLKLGAKHIPLIEGVAHRSEHVFEFVFEEDPFYPLFVAYRRHHTAVRIMSDIMLRYEGRPIADCVKLYMDELGFDHATARGQVRAQEQMEGYFTCYYYGLKKITGYERELGLDSRAFTELLFSCGNVSMTTLEGFLKLDDVQRESYLNDFGSKLMAPQDVAKYGRAARK